MRDVADREFMGATVLGVDPYVNVASAASWRLHDLTPEFQCIRDRVTCRVAAGVVVLRKERLR